MVSNATTSTIANNTIYNIITSATTPVGITLYTGLINSTIKNNKIDGVKYTGTGGYGGRGMFVNTSSSTSNLIISNNVINNIGGDGWSGFSNSSPVGLYFDGTTGGLKIYNNTVNMDGDFTRSTATLTTAVLFYTTTITNIDLRNNIFKNNMNNTGSTGAKNYAIYSSAPITSFTQIDNNDYYVSGVQGVLGYLGSDITTLSAWKTATGKDANSLSVDPLFTSSTDLSLQATSQLAGSAAVIPSVTTDYTGALRGLYMPTIGAYELAEPATRTLNLKLYLQGLCGDGFAGTMNTAKNDMGEDNYSDPNIAEKISILIFDASNYDPYDPTTAVVTTTENYLSTNGNVSLDIDKSLSGNYYIVVKTRNHLETWSATPISFNSKVVSYNYTTAANKAYGNNQIQIGTSGSYAIYGGDVNQDGGIDSNDMGDIDNDSFNLATGYLLTDVNGDGGVDSNDMGIVDNNSFNLISVNVPTP